MAKIKPIAFNTPLGILMWIFITGKGKKDLKDNDRFSATIEFEEKDEAFIALEKQIKEFWKENRPSAIRKAKSNGIKRVYEKKLDAKGQPVLDEDEVPIKVATTRMSVNFWTGITWPDGKPKVIDIYNAKNAKVSLGDKKIGNGTIGAIGGAMAIYENGSEAGVTLFLNTIQIKKFVEYTGGDAGFADVGDDDEDNFTGIDEETGFETGEAKPRL